MSSEYGFDWAHIAFGSKKPLKSLKATFIPAPRDISEARFIALVKELLPKGNIILGLAKEDYIDGFDGQLQFKTLAESTVVSVINKVNRSASKNKIYTLHYAQREVGYIVEKLEPSAVVLVRGSWLHAFHTTPLYYSLMQQRIPYRTVSPFIDETEAKDYGRRLSVKLAKQVAAKVGGKKGLDEHQVLQLLDEVRTPSFDYSFQTGLILARKRASGYEIVDYAHNIVVPYETYAFHNGASREVNFSPPHDLNHYDTVHAEVTILLHALQRKQSVRGLTIFINLLPCPPCSRMISQTDISELVYSLDHSDGYGLKLLEATGKTVRRVVS